MKKIFPYLIISILLYSCSSTNNLTIRITNPAPINIPGDVKNVGIVNRTNSTVNSTLNKIDEIMTMELLTVDSSASLKLIDGLNDELIKNSRFNNVKNFSPMMLKNSAVGRFSPTLAKNKIVTICNDNNLDALFVLEYFDTDTRVNYSLIPVTTRILGVEVKAMETMASVRTNINAGWRIYNYSGDIIYDEFALKEHAMSTGRGINPLKAINAVTGQKKIVEQVSYNIGKKYALDLLPYSSRVHRIYFVRGTDNFKVGKRLAQIGKWDDAASYWEKETTNPKTKIAGRAYYNMAIINEINGDLDSAIDWAGKSHTLFYNKKALSYLNTLKFRKTKNDELIRQQVNN